MPTLKVGDHEFECQPTLPGWQLLKLADAQVRNRNGDGYAYFAGLHGFIGGVLLPAELVRFEDTVGREPVDWRVLDAAVGELIGEYTDRPTAPPSSSQAGRPSTPGTSEAVSSSPERRVVSLAKREAS